MNKFIREANSYFCKTKAIAKNTSETTDSLEVGGVYSALEVIIDVTTKIQITSTKTLSITLQESADNTDFSDRVTIYSATSPDDINAAEGWLRFTLPADIKKYARLKVTTNDGSAAGAITAYLHLV